MNKPTTQKIHSQGNSFVLRIWWEQDSHCTNKQSYWRGKIQHAVSGKYLAFQSLDELLQFIQSYTGDL